MNRITAALAALVTAVALTGCGEQQLPVVEHVAPVASAAPPMPMLISHRGGPLVYPESSWAGYRASAKAGYALELDLRTLKDGTVGVMHDATVDRTTNGSGPVSGFTRTSWTKLAINGGGGAPPTWRAFLDEFAGHTIVVESKDRPSAEAIVSEVHARGLEGSVIAQSFSLEDVRAFEAAGLDTMLLSNKADPVALAAAGVDWLGLSTSAPDRAAAIRRAQAAGLRVAVYTVRSASVGRQLAAEGVDAYFADNPWGMPKKRERVEVNKDRLPAPAKSATPRAVATPAPVPPRARAASPSCG